MSEVIPKIINKAALERNRTSLIIGAHDKSNLKTKTKDEQKFTGIGVSNHRVRHNLTGAVDKSINSIWMNFGKGFTSE